MSAERKALSIGPRLASVPTQDRGRLMTAAEVADVICQGKVSAKWIIGKWAHRIGRKPGKSWLFYEADARTQWDDYWNAPSRA